MLDLVLTLSITGLVIVVMSRLRHRQHRLRHTNPVSRSVAKVSSKHAAETGAVVDILWPLGYMYLPATIESLSGKEERRWGRHQMVFARQRTQQRPFFVPMTSGRHVVAVSAQGRKQTTEDEVVLDVPNAGHALLLCWPAKRALATPARATTTWRTFQLTSEHERDGRP